MPIAAPAEPSQEVGSTDRGASKTLHHRQTPRFRRVAALLARRVRALREARGWSVEAAAEHMSVEPAHVRRLETGTANPSLAVLISVAHAFDLHVTELLAAPKPRRRT